MIARKWLQLNQNENDRVDIAKNIFDNRFLKTLNVVHTVCSIICNWSI